MFINSGLKLRTLEVCRAGTIATNDIITRSCVKALPKTLRRLVFDFKNALFVITPAAPIARFGDSSPVNRFIDLASLLPDLEELIIRQPARDKTYAHYIVESSSLALLPASLRLLCALDISLEDEKMDLASLLPTSLTSLEMLVDPTKVSSWPPQLTFLRPVGEELDSISAPNETWPKLPSSLKSLKCSHQAYRDGSALALPLLTELSILRTSNPLVWVKGSFPSNLTDLRLMDSDSYFDFDLAILPRTLTRLELTLDWQALERSVKLANPFPASLSQVAVPNASADEAGSEAIDPADLHLMDLRKRGELDLSFWPPALRLLKSVGFSTSSDLSKTVQFYLIPPTIEDLSVKATLNEDILLDPLLLFPSLAAFSFFAYSAYSLSLAPSFGQLRSLRRLVLSSSTKLPEHFPDSLKHLQLSYNAAQVIPRLQASGGLPVGIESIQADFTSSWGWGMSPLVSESLFTHWPATLTSIRFQQSMLLRSIVVMPPSLIELHCKDTIIHDPSTQVEPSYSALILLMILQS